MMTPSPGSSYASMPERVDPPYRGEMLERARALAARLRREDRVDLGLVGLMAVAVMWEGLSHSLGTAGRGAAIAWGLAEIAPLAVRRRFPLAVWLTILALVIAQATATGSNDGFGVFLGLLVGAYTVGAYTPRRAAAVSWLLLVPVVSYTSWRTTGDPLADTAFIVILVSGFWVVGRVVWSRNQLVLLLAEQAEELRRGRDAARPPVHSWRRTAGCPRAASPSFILTVVAGNALAGCGSSYPT